MDLDNSDERSILLEEEVEKLKKQIEFMEKEKEIVSTLEDRQIQHIDKHKTEIFKKLDDGYEAMEDLI
ncbi:MAG: hypothetical protein GY775_17895, partial [Candidatus Scalindua sp.]|nr:hypothetical protein [Candidatus Scalindua sp.]